MSRLLQVVLAIVGLVLTAVLQHASNRNAEVQNAQGLVQLYTEEVAAALTTCNLSMLQVAQDTAVELNQLRASGVLRGQTDFEQHVLEVGDTMTGCTATGAAQTGGVQLAAPAPLSESAPQQETAVAPELVAQSRNLELRGIERRIEQTTESRDAPEHHYAVLASYAVSDPSTYDDRLGAAAHFNQLASAARAAGLQVEVFRTSLSNHFAIVLPATTSDAARDLVAMARRMGWAPDAFVQAERNWTRCANPGTPDSLRACAGEAIRRPTRGSVPRAPG